MRAANENILVQKNAKFFSERAHFIKTAAAGCYMGEKKAEERRFPRLMARKIKQSALNGRKCSPRELRVRNGAAD